MTAMVYYIKNKFGNIDLLSSQFSYAIGNTNRDESEIRRKDAIQKIEELNKIGNGARSQILEALQPILAKYAEKNDISIIVDKKNVIVGKTNLDITKTIIDELNKKLPSIKLN